MKITRRPESPAWSRTWLPPSSSETGSLDKAGDKGLKHRVRCRASRWLTPAWALLLAVAAAWLTACQPAERTTSLSGAAQYHCPMHPTYVSDRPGDCPICNMKLVPIKEAPSPASSGVTNVAVPGRTSIHVTPEKEQLIGLRTSSVRPRDLTHVIRTTGIVEHDETTLTRIAPRFGGWARRLYLNYVGQPVQQGQPLLSVYSPELLVTERDYLLAYRQSQASADAARPDQRAAARQLLEAARQRLRLWEIGDEEIQALEQRGQPSDELLLRAPVSGHVVAKNIVEGKAFMAGETLYEIAELSRLWVRASIFEYELSRIQIGQPAQVLFPNLGQLTRTSSVAFIYPHLDPQTRRAEIRLELDNPRHELRPEMWANVEIEAHLGERLTVPASAVIDTGTRFIAFVRHEDGHLEPRELKLGARTDDFYEVLEGVREGERVVTRALFLIDSESQLKAAIAGMTGGGDAEAPPLSPAGEHAH